MDLYRIQLWEEACTKRNPYVGDGKTSFAKRVRAVVANPIFIGSKSFVTMEIVTNMFLLLPT